MLDEIKIGSQKDIFLDRKCQEKTERKGEIK